MVTVKRKRRVSEAIQGAFSGHMHYKNVVRGIEPAVGTAWLIILPSGAYNIAFWHAGAKIEDVHSACRVWYPSGFKVGRLDVGTFVVQKIDHYMTGDGRMVDQDWIVYTSAEARPLEDPFSDS